MKRALRTAAPLVLTLWALVGCEVDPYCIDCADGGGMDAGTDAGRDSGSGFVDARSPDAEPVDAGPELPDGCVPGSVERCNELDDDCDLMVDEGIDTSRDPNHCGGCNMPCSLAHALSECVDGACNFTGCDVGYYDLNDMPDDGCEYRCVMTDSDDVRCDLRDNDCDGAVDEDVMLDSDPSNCGSCGRTCRFSHAMGACVASTCELGTCDEGFHDADGNPANGCEYSCILASPAVETCNLRDDDCDGTIDEGDPGGGAACGTDEGECAMGIERCVGGAITCTGGVSPDVELCNGRDDDCDASTDEANPEGGRLCGTGVGTCEPGREVCTSGALVCTGAIGPVTELCNGLDDDCDGTIDNGDPGGGGNCGIDTGECAFGTEHCRGGVIACEGAVGPRIEICDGLDQDCDGVPDDGNPEGGGICGSDVGTCRTGVRQCTAGALVCVGATGAGTETCDALDNDCDGRVDEGNPGGGASCGSNVGECSSGTESCVAGSFVCMGAVGATTEICDGLDNDCDGTADEGNPGGGASCGSNVGACVAGARVCSGGALVCMGDVGPTTEVCNSIDDDCDGSIDEMNPGGGASCGIDTGECSFGSLVCTSGALVCTGGTGPTTETCDGLDNDCDGTADDGNPGGGGSCGTDVGACSPGTRVCTGGALVCMGAVGPTAETCNGIDDNCNGSVDEGNPGGGGSCGIDTGECSFGSLVCTSGALVCAGGTGPTTEICDGLDNDCDGTPDDGNPGGGGSCGTDVGECNPGTRVCTAGALVCMGGTSSMPETCDSLDNDCDGSVDEGNPGGGASCGIDTGECSFGTRVCSGGSLVCTGGTGPSIEICDGLDNDCNGTPDDGFDLNTNVNHCGMCNRVCTPAFAVPTCTAGTCQILACQTGHVDLDGDPTNGCEYACDVAGAEVCNGRDDDCDGLVDELLTPPPTLCNPNGVCAGTTATCTGMGGWVCNYTHPQYQATEARCDGLDNDCDGGIDEPFPLVGTGCNNGELGECRRTGTFVCNGTFNGVVCNAPAVGSGTAEICDGLDNDCDGTLDDGAPANWVQFTSGGSTRWIMQYEASRPDARVGTAGAMTHRVCSEPTRLPWTQVTYAQAQTACGTIGARLCTETEWRDACRSQTGGCGWGYASSCSTPQPTTCNGNDYDPIPGPPDDDTVLPTGSLPMCYADWGATARRIYDMSGNVEEWAQARSAGVNPLRGGSYIDTVGGTSCNFDFQVAGNTYQTQTVGFRCCRSTAP